MGPDCAGPDRTCTGLDDCDVHWVRDAYDGLDDYAVRICLGIVTLAMLVGHDGRDDCDLQHFN